MKLNLNKRTMFFMLVLGALASLVLPIILKVLLMGVLIFISVACISSESKDGVREGAILLWISLGLVCVPGTLSLGKYELIAAELGFPVLGLMGAFIILRMSVKMTTVIEEKEKLKLELKAS